VAVLKKNKNMKYTILTICLLFLLSCQSDTKTVEAPPPIKSQPEKKALPPPPPPTLEDNRWNAFWEKFKVAVETNDAETVASLTALPLKGSEPMFNGKIISKKMLIENFDKIFDKETKETIETTTANMADFAVKKEATAKRLNVPVNTKIRSINVLYIHDKGTNRQTETSVIYHFAKLENEYKLVSLMFAG